ncbi:sperm acrosome membrane-associated protein 6 [Genypterus blacodes]|uniref:sperm acrosome membrane-associated protein 6 n=1 Tax=Genypterus blacodes TaxID=154954 RepID=UPI003F768832
MDNLEDRNIYFMPPSGFQYEVFIYDCKSCWFDSCDRPLDCEVIEINVMEDTPVQMNCTVKFSLPDNVVYFWSFAEEETSAWGNNFTLVTAGSDALYSIPSAQWHHQGTYQCEITSDTRPFVRLYFYVNVTLEVMEGYTELQDTFDLALLPAGQIIHLTTRPPPTPPPPVLPWSVLLTACLTALLLLLFLCMG